MDKEKQKILDIKFVEWIEEIIEKENYDEIEETYDDSWDIIEELIKIIRRDWN
jgi:hypothetical protein